MYVHTYISLYHDISHRHGCAVLHSNDWYIMLRGGLGRLGEAWVGLGKAWGMVGECFREAWGDLGGLFYPNSASLGKLGEAWGGLGNAWECFGEAWWGLGNAWERFGEVWGGLGKAWGMLWESFGEAWEGCRGLGIAWECFGRLGEAWGTGRFSRHKLQPAQSQPQACLSVASPSL